MPNTFSTQAANADILGDDGSPAGMTSEIGADGTPRDRSDRAAAREIKTQQTAAEQVRPGKDAEASFVKDKDADKP